MQNHPYFNLRLHTDEELQARLNQALVERTTIHEWPLSCVQLLTFADETKSIYKSQYGPTVEAEFLTQAISPLLLQAEMLYQEDGHTSMIREYLDAPLLEDVQRSEVEIVDIGRRLIHDIQKIEGNLPRGDLPTYTDISNPSKWEAFVETTIYRIITLIDEGIFTVTTRDHVQKLREWTNSSQVLEALNQEMGIIHGDLTGDNIFLVDDGYRLIDWQRPAKAPAEVDLAKLLETSGIDPLKHIAPEIVGLFYFLQVSWAAECQTTWFPQGNGYDQWVRDFTEKISQLYSKNL